MMPSGRSCLAACFFETITRIFQSFSNGSFRGLCAVLQSSAGGFGSMFNCLSCLGCSLFDSITGFLDRVLIVGSCSQPNEK